MDNEMESNKRDHKVEITDIAISKVPYVRYREIPEEYYETLHQIAIAVLEYSKSRNDSNETAITYSLDEDIPEGEMSLAVAYGDEHSVDPLNNADAYHMLATAESCVIVIVHNHPSTSKVSLSDVGFLFGYKSVKMVVVVTNLGSINYIVKTDHYDREQAVKLFREAVHKIDNMQNLKQKQDATDYFLNNCYKAGLIFEDGRR